MTKIKNITNKTINVNGKQVKPNKTIELNDTSLVNYYVKNNIFEIIKQIKKESQNEQTEIKENIIEPTIQPSELDNVGNISDNLPRGGRRKKIKLIKEDEE